MNDESPSKKKKKKGYVLNRRMPVKMARESILGALGSIYKTLLKCQDYSSTSNYIYCMVEFSSAFYFLSKIIKST